MSSSKVNIRIAVPADQDSIVKGFEEWFWPYEPLSMGYPIKTPSILEKAIYASLWEKEGMTLVATDPDENGKIVGFFVNAINHPNFIHEIIEKIDMSSDERLQALIKIALTVEEKINIFQHYNVKETFHLVSLAVDPEKRGRNIGLELFKAGFRMAADMGYKVIGVDCTSKYSTNIAKHLNMDPIVSIDYKEYKDLQGNQVFMPPPEHTHMTRFIKVL